MSLFKKNMKVEKLPREEVIKNFIEEFLYDFHYQSTRQNLDVPELPDDVITNIINEYFNKKTLTEANRYIYDVLDEYVDGSYEKIDWNLGRPAVEETPEYKAWRRRSDISSLWSDCKRMNGIEETWVDLNGKANTNEEAAKKAADKWCELIFGWHLQDNGAINEDHAGGFMACALGTVLANKSKERISEDVKKKAHSLFYEYYLRLLHYNETHDKKDIDWLVENLPDDDKKDPFDWRYFEFRCDLYCDYGPGTPLYLILVNAGVDKRDAGSICPWKTGIDIRPVDNAVMYNTYQHREEL
jgi:hypothetical protein